MDEMRVAACRTTLNYAIYLAAQTKNQRTENWLYIMYRYVLYTQIVILIIMETTRAHKMCVDNAPLARF